MEETGEKKYHYKIWCRRGGFVFNAHQDDFKKPVDQILFLDALSDMQNSSYFRHLEVIGNIHENPELLK